MKKYFLDYKAIILLGLPILVGQLGGIVVGFADNIMVGRYSTEALASASFVNAVMNVVMFCLMGFSYGITPLVGSMFGRGERGAIGRLMRSALWINMLFALALMVIIALVYVNVDRLGQPAELLPLIRPYFLLFLAGLPAVALLNVFSQWSYGITDTRTPMWIVLIANAFNIAGNYTLIYGRFGLPELGLTGAGISTLVSRYLAAALMAAYFFVCRKNAEYRRGFCEGSAHKRYAAAVWRTSFPVALQMTFESGSFSVAGIMAGWLGTVALASFQIIVVVGTLGFCLYYAVGAAVTVLVANESGIGGCGGMRRVAWAGYHVMLAVATCSTALFLFGGRTLMGLFTDDAAVLSMVATLIFPLVLYQGGDATQIAFANALRGTGRVMPMLWVAFVSYIVVGIPATYLLAFPLGLGIYGIVLSFSVSLLLAGALFLVFFLRATKQ